VGVNNHVSPVAPDTTKIYLPQGSASKHERAVLLSAGYWFKSIISGRSSSSLYTIRSARILWISDVILPHHSPSANWT